MSSEVRPGTAGLLKRQLSSDVTRSQVAFDVIFGVIAPLIAIWLDPFVFREHFGIGGGMLTQVKVFAYMGIAIGLVLLVVWLVLGRSIRAIAGLMAGVFLFGAAFAGFIGAILLPRSLVGLLIFIGALGLIPFLTAFVYLRNGIRAIRLGLERIGKAQLIGSLILGLALVSAVSAAAQLEASRYVARRMETILHRDGQAAEMAAAQMRYAVWCSQECYDDLLDAYLVAEPARKEYLAKYFNEMTGWEIEVIVDMTRMSSD